MLGAMCHNAINVVAKEMKIDGNISWGQCELLGSLSTHPDRVIQGIIRLLIGAIGSVSFDNETVRVSE